MSEKIAVVGLGYVGLPLAVCFARRFEVIGYDHDPLRVEELRAGKDRLGEVPDVGASGVSFRDDPACLREADVVIVTVPTPVDESKRPDLSPLLGASRTVGENLGRGATIVFESTVYPGATEDDCIPIIEAASGWKWKSDFHVGYSPERINPGDPERSVDRIVKVVAGDSEETAARIAKLYGTVVTAGIHIADSIRVAEAAKVIENCQRDINIAFVNELAIIFQRLGIDTAKVLEAAGTKWNFLPFRPGLVGGHCIGVDPYYLTHKAESVGYHPQVILSGRRINDGMGTFVANRVVKRLISKGSRVREARILVMGATFKENCPDVRNSRVFDIVNELEEFGAHVEIYDPIADAERIPESHRGKLISESIFRSGTGSYDAAILAVAHSAFAGIRLRDWVGRDGVVYDVKSILPIEEVDERL
jgi:UDP-N-acetyl-D-galactosamine dehydrogenase